MNGKKKQFLRSRCKIAIKNYCPKRHKEGKGPKTQKVYVPAKQIYR